MTLRTHVEWMALVQVGKHTIMTTMTMTSLEGCQEWAVRSSECGGAIVMVINILLVFCRILCHVISHFINVSNYMTQSEKR